MSRFVRGLLYVVAAMFTMWAAAALFVDARPWVAAVFIALVVALLVVTRASRRGVALWVASLAAVTGWWFSQKPTNDRNWQHDVDRVAWAEISGDTATIHNIRNFDYVTEEKFTPRWDAKNVDLSKIRGVDLFLSHWGSPWIAHAIASFAFEDGTYLAVSVEARKIVGQEYSAIRAFFRQYELLYLIAEERDVVALRTNYRGENVYLYRTLTTPADAQNLFRQYLQWMNAAREHPVWYNALTQNCVSSFVGYLANAKVGGVTKWDWRNIADGKADEMLFNLGDFVSDGLPFAELQKRALIDAAAQKAGATSDFSRAIRRGRPGFSKEAAELEIPLAVTGVSGTASNK